MTLLILVALFTLLLPLPVLAAIEIAEHFANQRR